MPYPPGRETLYRETLVKRRHALAPFFPSLVLTSATEKYTASLREDSTCVLAPFDSNSRPLIQVHQKTATKTAVCSADPHPGNTLPWGPVTFTPYPSSPTVRTSRNDGVMLSVNEAPSSLRHVLFSRNFETPFSLGFCQGKCSISEHIRRPVRMHSSFLPDPETDTLASKADTTFHFYHGQIA